jgi:C1A family cysteine protease
MPGFTPPGLGWQRDLPDQRDYGPEHERVKPLLAALRPRRPARGARPGAVDWAEFLSPADSVQGPGSCAAHACAALVEYFERRAHGRSLDGSSRFLSRTASLLGRASRDTGASLRTTLKALVRFGLPPRAHWPDDDGRCDDEPSPHLFAYARDYQGLLYLRLDGPGQAAEQTLAAVKSFVAAGLPVAFGFTVYNSVLDEAAVPYPSCFDATLGGQVVVTIGYDDRLRIRSERGALRVRNSWGAGWGDRGYGWLPYRYVTGHLAADFWTVLRPDWLEAGDFLPLA